MPDQMGWYLCTLLIFYGVQVQGQFVNNVTVFIPYEYTYLLPSGFLGNLDSTFVNSTTTSNDSINSLLYSASQSPFIAYDREFLDILGPNPTAQLIEQRSSDDDFAYEAGIWVPERHEVWFTPSPQQATRIPSTIYAFNLDTQSVSPLEPSEPAIDVTGGTYFEGKVYFSTYRNQQNYRGGIISIDANTLHVESVLNSHFGLRFNGIDDIAWAVRGNNQYMFFTDFDYTRYIYSNLTPAQMPSNVWRWDAPDQSMLYVTDTDAVSDTTSPLSVGTAAASWLGPYIYAWDLDKNMFPVNKRLFGMVRFGIADGLHVDDAGRVWTAEGEGVVVRNPQGKVLGMFNGQYFQADKRGDAVPIANFALAGDTLVILSTTRLWTVKLGQAVVSSTSAVVN
ncbi:hypothetical protein EV356DRAFT_559773 [Viridothelium virens]|uniref:Calcium-dependent phosphotriesterase n=1 Tax=Viridothelium virens TaxID=1048519 RepID=A0A6A6H7A0_VIRVR|nr:hypothetical protein EV356DRAFT_559773 [Viridothelium virens]